jgi:DNA-binding transcriptional LysR family regulator
MIPTETEIRHFFAVYATRHFTRAAIKLGIAQPSLTQSIQKLEKKTKTLLFHRTKQGCIPTPSADLFFAKAQQLRESWKALSEDLNQGKTFLQGTFRVGCHASVGTYTLPKFLKALSVAAPQIQVKLFHDWSRNINEKIINFELDLGFVINPFKHRDLVLRKLGDDQVCFWKATGKVPPKILFADMNLTQTRTLLTSVWAKKFANWQLIETPNLELIRTLVTQGAGVGILPTRVVQAEASGLEHYAKDLPQFHDEIFLAYRVGTLNSAAGKKLIDCARASL